MVTVTALYADQWAAIVQAARAHLEDLETGVADGLYEAAENAETIAALRAALAALDESA